MTQNRLTTDLIDAPDRWRLLMRYDNCRAFDVMLFDRTAGDSLIYRHFPSDSDQSPLKALQDIVYDNPLLTEAEFKSSHFIVADATATPLPDALDDSGRAVALAAATDLDDRAIADRTIYTGSGTRNAVFAFTPESDVAGFVRRTFPGVTLHPVIEPLCRYFTLISARGNGRKMFVNFRPGCVDIIVLDRSTLLLANTFASKAPDDLVYYILACRDMLGLANEADPVMTSGDSPERAETMAGLRRFVSPLLPVIFPSAIFQAGNCPTDSPFDLIALALCE